MMIIEKLKIKRIVNNYGRSPRSRKPKRLLVMTREQER